jgi:hypothetical protein
MQVDAFPAKASDGLDPRGPFYVFTGDWQRCLHTSLCGVMEYLNPGYGVDVAMSLVLGEAAGGLFLETRLAAWRRDAWTWGCCSWPW